MPEPLAWAIARNIGASLVAMPVTDDQACQPTQPTRLDRPPPAARQRRWSVAAEQPAAVCRVSLAGSADTPDHPSPAWRQDWLRYFALSPTRGAPAFICPGLCCRSERP